MYREFDLSEIPMGIEVHDHYPEKFELSQNYPNPFNQSTVIRYSLSVMSDVQLNIYNCLGQRIKTLVHSKMQAGQNQTIWDGTNEAGRTVSSGIYLYKLETGVGVKTKKMLLQK